MEFTPVTWTPECFNNSDTKEMLLQWNLDQALEFGRFRFTGTNLRSTTEDYLELLTEFLKHVAAYGIMGISGSVASPLSMDFEELSLTLLSMDVFNKLEDAGLFVDFNCLILFILFCT
jgi:hypothetical protein